VVEVVLDQREVYQVEVDVGAFAQPASRESVGSFVAGCHRDRGAQKNTSMSRLCSTSAQRAISVPWSQVRVLTISGG